MALRPQPLHTMPNSNVEAEHLADFDLVEHCRSGYKGVVSLYSIP